MVHLFVCMQEDCPQLANTPTLATEKKELQASGVMQKVVLHSIPQAVPLVFHGLLSLQIIFSLFASLSASDEEGSSL